MERLNLRRADAQKALETFKSILREPYSVIIRDATIQRFEYTFEAFWKFLKDYLKEKEGVEANTPKAVFRALFTAGYLSEVETVEFLEMTDCRNETSHTYKEAVAQTIYEKAKDYPDMMEGLLDKLEAK